MKQVLQSFKTGVTEVVDVPCPRAKSGHLLTRTSRSLISAGTERMLVEFGKAGLIEKARQQPDKVKQVLDKIKTDGLMPTIEAVQSKLDTPIPLGYCNVGTVMEVGAGVEGFSVGDRIASNGNHAEVVCVPANLCAKIPEPVSDEAGSFTVLGSIALQGLRLAEPTLGEAFVVMGLGLVGLLSVQLLRAHGCRVLGADFDPSRLALARKFGAETVDLSRGEDPIAAAMAFSRGRGVDGIIIAAATKSNDPIKQAPQMCRKRGRIVLVGVVGLQLSRADFFEKEISFQVSCSYGPGRYDPLYEEGGQDYPIGFVRWTEQRNFEAVLDMLAEGKLDVSPLISHSFPIERAEEAYDLLSGEEASIGILLEYPGEEARPEEDLRQRTVALPVEASAKPAEPAVGFIGAGDYATRILIPAFRKAGAGLHSVASSGGVTSTHAARKFGFKRTTTDSDALLADDEINAIAIATNHDSHAQFVCQALRAGKHVFVEKPLAIKEEQLTEIEAAYTDCGDEAERPLLMVGFNRRFSPLIVKAKQLLETVREPKSFIMTVNAGAIPSEHWTQDPEIGGGRIIGEGCHFIDLLRFLAAAPIVSVKTCAIGGSPGDGIRGDKVSFTLAFADGSFGTVHYLANGHRSFPKERLEVFCGGGILQLDNFRRLQGFGWPGFGKMKLGRQDKGQVACAAAFVEAVRKGVPSPIPFQELAEVTRVSFEVAKAAR